MWIEFLKNLNLKLYNLILTWQDNNIYQGDVIFSDGKVTFLNTLQL